MPDATMMRRLFEALNEELKARIYPHRMVPPKTQFLVEELFDQLSGSQGGIGTRIVVRRMIHQ